MKRNSTCIKKLLAVFLSCIVASPMICQATEPVKLDSEMSINVHLADQFTSNGKQTDSGTIVYDLYKLADLEQSGSGFSYQVEDTYKNLGLENAVSTKQESKKIDWSKIAQDAMKATVGSTEGTYVNKPVGAAYTDLELDQANIVDKGLYLLIARTKEENKTIIKNVTVHDSNMDTNQTVEDQIATYMFLGNEAVTISPLIVCIPTKQDENGNVVSTDQKGTFIYNQDIYLKMEVTPTTGKISITKNLKGYFGDAENATFVFQVDTYYPDENTLYSSEVYSLVFSNQGTKKLVVEGLPVGAYVKVKEVYSGINYKNTTVTPEGGTVLVRPYNPKDSEDMENVTFENEYNKKTGGGGGIVNHFKYNQESQWSWSKDGDNEATKNGLTDKLLQMILGLFKSEESSQSEQIAQPQ